MTAIPRSEVRGADLVLPLKTKTGIDNPRLASVFMLFHAAQSRGKTMPGSSVAEQVTVNHLVAGSIPARAAMKANNLSVVGLLH